MASDKTTFDPKIPGSPASLKSVGLKASPPYKDEDEFQNILVNLIADILLYEESDLNKFKDEMCKYLSHLGVNHEVCLNKMEDASWTENETFTKIIPQCFKRLHWPQYLSLRYIVT